MNLVNWLNLIELTLGCVLHTVKVCNLILIFRDMLGGWDYEIILREDYNWSQYLPDKHFYYYDDKLDKVSYKSPKS